MTDNSVKQIVDVAGIPSIYDPVVILAGSLPLVRQGQATGAGTMQVTASLLRAIVGQDADWSIPGTTTHVVVPSPTASRAWSLPDVDGYPYGQDLVIADEGKFLGGAYTVTLIPLAGSGDSIRDYPSGIVMQDAGATVRLRRGLLSDTWILA